MTPPTAACTRADCPGGGTGRINPRGFCTECGRRPAPTPSGTAPGPAAPGTDPGAPTGGVRSGATTATDRARRRDAARKFSLGPAGDGLLDLPHVELPSLTDLVLDDPRPPSRGQICGRPGCEETVGAPYNGEPALSAGFCPRCRHPFDFTPRLRPGDLLGDQYKVIGCVAYGGLGWVYLAEDTQLDRQPVAIKGLINNEDEAALRAAVEERRYLTMLDHPGIVRIINYVTQPEPGSDRLTGYIVMEFVGGMTLAQIRDCIADAMPPYDGPRLYEHILAYGCLVLRAVGYLHGERLLYCDLKPSNVMHYESRIKVIDLGAVRRLGRQGGDPPVVTQGFASPESLRGGPLTERHDLYGVGATLRSLSDKAGRPAQAPPGLGAESYRRVLARATARDPRRRFGSAGEMSEQLWGVLREIHALRLREEQPEPSTLFAPTAALLDAGLGRIPGLEHWLDGDPRRALAHGLPSPEQVPPGLPVPFPDAADPGAALLNTPTDSGPRRLIEQLGAFPYPSAEIRFRTCRAYLDLGMRDRADAELTAAEEIIGSGAAYDWRPAWHRALLRLAGGAVAEARRAFDEVYSALPGEYAPKLALGYCAEHLGDHDAAKRFYEAVWERNRSQGSAAFGLARLRLAAGDRGGAATVLDGVPKVSRHYDAARIATVRVLAGRLGEHPHDQATGEDLVEVLTRLPRLYLDDGRAQGQARDRLTAEVLEAALDRTLRQGAAGDPAGAGLLFGEGDDELSVRSRLEAVLRRLARQADSPEALGVLVDRANAVRPMTGV
ncbi:serine/threonine-protein kinase [Streptomyces botrytidirepellens]|uniref:non-specific serine/threonine protein kinase n=1 Tax=Streptomyces botrytidirepellens TaxID=2486417 RepID=A0A3M8VJV7_9ACTN|nr:serine/threonine-protein kinase [Streptomyces botrytidirepellens]RNG16695.1 serine/threonine protein kinase [Streptomyces botrytidirepellens]